MPRVTVVIPCFNAERHLAAAIEGVLCQTVSDFELLIIDDGSTDESATVAAALVARDPRIRMFRQANQGVAIARNRGFERATTPFVAFLDADDRWHPSYLDKTLALLTSDARLGVAFARCRFIDLFDRPTGQVTRPKLRGIELAHLLEANPTATCSNLVVRREVFDKVGGFRAGMQHAEDQEWLFRVRAAGFLLGGIDELLVDYRTSSGGLSSALERMLAGWESFAATAREIAPDIVARSYPKARAAYLGYLARRALRLGRPPREALAFLIEGLRADPRLALRSPRNVLGTLVVSLGHVLEANPSSQPARAWLHQR